MFLSILILFWQIYVNYNLVNLILMSIRFDVICQKSTNLGEPDETREIKRICTKETTKSKFINDKSLFTFKTLRILFPVQQYVFLKTSYWNFRPTIVLCFIGMKIFSLWHLRPNSICLPDFKILAEKNQFDAQKNLYCGQCYRPLMVINYI
jgi:hypothetical protein